MIIKQKNAQIYAKCICLCIFKFILHNKIVENASFVDENAHNNGMYFVIIDERGCGREEKSVQIN